MKTQQILKLITVLAVGTSILGATKALSQDSAANAVSPPAAGAAIPQLAYGVSEILHLAQAKVGDDTIVAYIKNSGNTYSLNADQIIYLRQQGVSAAVINLMLNQTKAADAPVPATVAPQPATAAAAVAPPVTYVQTPNTYYYYSAPNYYPIYGGYSYGYTYPAVSLSFGWGGRWGGGWHGGGHGWHR